MDRRHGFCFYGATFINRLTNHVHDTAKCFWTNRHSNRRFHIRYGLTANKAFRCVHRDGAHCVLSQMLSHFENQTIALVVSLKRVEDCRQIAVKFHINNRANDLANFACRLRCGFLLSGRALFSGGLLFYCCFSHGSCPLALLRALPRLK